jgi:ADP-ribosylglycohydrolase
MPSLRRASGCLFGLACGDALGAPTEFFSVNEIRARFAPGGPLQPEGDPRRVTDDTQMALAVGEALMQTPCPNTPANPALYADNP